MRGLRRRFSLLLGSLLLDLLYLGLSPLLFICLLVASAGFTRPKLRRGLLQKLGLVVPRRPGGSRSFWVHAVSVGEVLTALPLVEALRSRYPDWDLWLSVSTFTGLEVARKHLKGTPVFYFPFDLSPVVLRFFRRQQPTVVLLLELELWPNFLLAACRKGIPVLVANARITERSARRYAVGGKLTRAFFNLVSSFGAQNEAYRERFLRLGVAPHRVEVLGNLKHDRAPLKSGSEAKETRSRLGWDGEATVVLVAGSTHPGEEKALSDLYHELREKHESLRLVLVPRHVERLDEAELARWGAREHLARWRKVRGGLGSSPVNLGTDILLVDTVGELEFFYSLADIVFVGGSLVSRGGHNLLEPARLGKPLLFGPHFENFEEEGSLLLREGAAISVGDEKGLCSAVERLLDHPEERQELGERAFAVSCGLRGATARHLEWLERQMRLSSGESVC